MRSHSLRTLVATWRLGPLVLAAAGLLSLVGHQGVANAAPKTDPVNLTQFIGPDFFAALVVHPSRLAKSPMLAGLSQPDTSNLIKSGPPEAALAAEFFKSEKVRRVVVLVASTAEGGIGASHLTVGAIIQFNEDVDSESFLKQVFKDAEPATLGEVTYLTSKAKGIPPDPAAKTPGVPSAAYVAGPRTLLIALEPAMKKMLAPATGPRTLLEQLKHSSLNNDVLIQIAAEPLLKSEAGAMLKVLTQAQPKSPGVDLIDDVKSIALALNVTQDPLLKLTVAGAKPDSADKFNGLMQVAKMGIVSGLDGLKKNPPSMLPPALKEPLFKVTDEIVAALQIAKQGDEVSLTITQPPSLPALVQKAAETAKSMAAAFGPGGPGVSGLPAGAGAAPPAGSSADPFGSPSTGAAHSAPPSATPPAAAPPASGADPFAPPSAVPAAPATPAAAPAAATPPASNADPFAPPAAEPAHKSTETTPPKK